MKKKKKKSISSLKELQQEQLRLQVMEKALKQEIIRESTSMVDRVKADIYYQIGKTSDIIQLGLAGVALYQKLSQPKSEHQSDLATASEATEAQMGVSNWLEIAADVAKVLEK